MLFIQLSNEVKLLYLCMMIGTVFLSLYVVIESIFYGHKKYQLTIHVIMFMIHFYVLQLMTLIAEVDKKLLQTERGMRFAGIEVLQAWILLFAMMILTFFSLYRTFLWKKRRITSMSIKQGLDYIDTALCFFRGNGFVLLKNHKMRELGFQIINSDIMDANAFWEDLIRGNIADGNDFIENRKNPVVQLADESIWSFEKIRVKMGDEEIYQIVGVDITAIENMNLELNKKNEELHQRNVHLKELMIEIDELVHSEEVLMARARIHDDFGKILIATKLFLTQNHFHLSKESILEMWRKNIGFISRREDLEAIGKSIKSLYDAANFIGMQVIIKGDIPKEEHIKDMILTGASECLTNASNHANAGKLFIEIESTTEGYVVRYSNDGVIPKREIKEGSGLSSLRNIVENHNARMSLSISPKFELMLCIPKKGGQI